MPPALRGKTVLVTGAAVRVGRNIARTLAAEGADVVVHYRRSERPARALCAEIQSLDRKAWAIGADFERTEEAEALIARVLEAAGSLDVLVNNASGFAEDRVDSLTFEALVASLRVNAWAPFALARAFARSVPSGAVVNVLDTRVWGFDTQHVGYWLSKRMLADCTRLLALELAPAVTVNGVAPGAMLPPPHGDETDLRRLGEALPVRRHGSPEDVARAVLFLATNPFVTGEIVRVDGGQHLAERPWTES